jgi:predicted GTPase
MGYDERQIQELRETIEKVPCDLVLVGTPVNLGEIIQSKKPMLRISYEMDQPGTEALGETLDKFLASLDR